MKPACISIARTHDTSTARMKLHVVPVSDPAQPLQSKKDNNTDDTATAQRPSSVWSGRPNCFSEKHVAQVWLIEESGLGSASGEHLDRGRKIATRSSTAVLLSLKTLTTTFKVNLLPVLQVQQVKWTRMVVKRLSKRDANKSVPQGNEVDYLFQDARS